MALLNKQLEVRESGIPGAGKGLFTNVFIPKGARIVEYKGKIKTWKEVQDDDSNYYIFYVTEDRIIDAGKNKKSLARYVNDAKGLRKIKGLNNNAQFVIDGERVFVEATKNIAAEAEIFVGYGKEYWDVIKANLKEDQKKSKS